MTRPQPSTNEVVIYQNDLNRLPLKGLSDLELNLFFAIVAKMKYTPDNTAVIPDSYIEGYVDPKQHLSRKRLYAAMQSMFHKIYDLGVLYGNARGDFGEFHIFASYQHSAETRSTIVHATDEAAYMFNQLDREFTRFELQEYLRLPGIYPKQLYRLLKQWRTKGEYRETMEEWRRLMDIPESYATRDITKRIVVPSVKVLGEIPSFRGLQYEYIHQGRTVVGIHFSWIPESPKKEKEYQLKEKAIAQLLGHKPTAGERKNLWDIVTVEK